MGQGCATNSGFCGLSSVDWAWCRTRGLGGEQGAAVPACTGLRVSLRPSVHPRRKEEQGSLAPAPCLPQEFP